MQNWHQTYSKVAHYVLMDRDGVINRRVSGGQVTSWERFEFLPRALEGLRMFAEHGYGAIVISNQACVGEGLMSSNELDVITKRFRLEVALSGGNVAAAYYCTHREGDGCNCRKPLPGLILRAQVEHRFDPAVTHFVCESETGVEAAEKAGCPSLLIRSDAFLHGPRVNAQSQMVTSNLLESAELIVALDRARTVEHVMAGAGVSSGKIIKLAAGSGRSPFGPAKYPQNEELHRFYASSPWHLDDLKA